MGKKWVGLGVLAALVLSLTFFACGEDDEEEKGASTPLATAKGARVESATEGPTPAVRSGPEEVILATTTSTHDSGLLDVLVPVFEEETGYNVKIIAVGTGQALAMGQRGDADVLLVHAPASEKALIDDGSAINRRLVMHNDFVIIGPEGDPAGVAGMTSAVDAMRKMADTGSTFVSRGDDSGTNKMELSLWKRAGVEPEGESWYEQSGQGMGATLQIANQKDAYTLTDRGTYLAQSENLSLVLLVEKDPLLLNVYSVMEVNPGRFDMVNGAGGKAFGDFMVSDTAQQMIGEFIDEKSGKQLFVPDGDKTYEDLGMETPFG